MVLVTYFPFYMPRPCLKLHYIFIDVFSQAENETAGAECNDLLNEI